MHDLAGLLMMPLAFVLLWLELKYLSYLIIELIDNRPLPLVLVRRPPLTRPLPIAGSKGAGRRMR
jgi:hypothetical protein